MIVIERMYRSGHAFSANRFETRHLREGLAVYSDEVQSTFLQELVRGMIRHPLERLEPWHKKHGGLAYAWFLR